MKVGFIGAGKAAGAISRHFKPNYPTHTIASAPEKG